MTEARCDPARPDACRLSDPGDKSDDHENAHRGDGGERTGHADPHRNLNEVEIVVHAGGLMFSARRVTSFDLTESDTILVSMKSQLGHSKVRFSQ
jgi:hypothetical protein